MNNIELMNKGGTRIITKRPDGSYDSSIKPIRNRTEFDNAIIYSENKSDKIKSKIKWNPMDSEWKDYIQHNFWAQKTLADMKKIHPQMDDRLFDFKNLLLSFGGEEVCLAGYEEDLDCLLNYGQLWIGNNIKMMRGLPSQCHSNSSRCWEENKDISKICTGYALSNDGMWRQHSWVLWMKPKSNQIIETTVPRVAYFGYVMTEEQCYEFADNNF